MKILSLLVWVSLFLTACGEEVAGRVLENPSSYALVCHGVNQSSHYSADNFGQVDSAWTWGYDDEGNAIYIDGEFEDGFFVAHKVYSWSLIRGKVRTFATDSGILKSLCHSSLLSAYPQRGLQLIQVGASTYSGYLRQHAIAFDERASELAFKRMVIFGDSFSDQGNLKQWVRLFPLTPYFFGRFADGPIWPDYLSHSSDITIHNWSFSGAQSGPHHDVPLIEIINYVKVGGRNFVTGSLSEYVDDYLAGDLRGQRVTRPGETLYAIWIGGNDFGAKFDNAYDIDHLLDDPPESPRGYVNVAERSAAGIVDQISKLYEVGARHFLVFNLPDFGIAPIVTENVLYHQSDTSMTLEQKRHLLSVRTTIGVQLHNRLLSEKIAALKKSKADIAIDYLDVDDIYTKMTHNIAPDGTSEYDYGFDLSAQRVELKDQDKPSIKGFNRCYTGGLLGSWVPRSVTCPQVNRAFYYDEVHPTSYVHCWLAYFVHRALSKGHSPAFDQLLLGQYRQMCNNIDDGPFGKLGL